MIARIVVQTNSLGEKHVVFTQDPITPIGEFLLSSPGWEDCDVQQARVLVLSLDPEDVVVNALMDAELCTSKEFVVV